MPVKISTLFRDSKFKKLSEFTKLTYIYLCTHPDLNMVGVLQPNICVIILELNITIEQLRTSVKQLVDINRLIVKRYDDLPYFIIPKHFTIFPKSESLKQKLTRTIDGLPEELTEFLRELYKGLTVKTRTKFEKPTVEEVTKYSLSLGYIVDGKEFVRYYDDVSKEKGYEDKWVDSRGTLIKDWKRKLYSLWTKRARKLKYFPDAPERFSRFYIIDNKSNVIQPEGWVRGKPYSSSIGEDVLLKKEFNKLNNENNM